MTGNNYIVTITVENLGNAGAEVPVILKTQETGDQQESGAARKVASRRPAPKWRRLSREVIVNDGSVPESDMTNNVYKIDIPAKTNPRFFTEHYTRAEGSGSVKKNPHMRASS